MTFTPTKTGQPTAAPLTVRPATPAPAPQRLQPPAEPSPQERARTSLTAHTTRPAHVQRQVASPVLSAATLQRQEEARLDGARAPLHRQAAELGAALPPGAVTTALQRHAAQHLPIAPPARPQGAADWVTVMRAHAQGIEGRNATTGLNSREVAQLSTLQRQVTQVIARDYRADRTPPAQRHATYAAHLLTLQRHPLSAPAARAALNLIPSGERPALQRALEDAARTDALQRQQDEQALALHAIQRQLAELDEQATQPVLHRIQARRGSGNPLPATVQRHLERGLNHDLSRVRIHDDAEADRLARGVNALAFTTGTDIYFRSGQFNPNTHTGLELLAHEVTHTVQQSQGKVGAGIDPDAGLEAQARHMGTTLAQMPALPTLVPAAHVGGPHAPGVYTHKAALKRAQAGAVQRASLKPLYDLQPGGIQRADDLTVQRWGLGDVWNATGGKVIEKGKEMIASGLQAIPGYHELCLAFGKDLVTGKTVGGSAEGILTALTNWVPGPLKDILRALKETNVIGKAWEWFKTQLGNLNLGGALSEIASAISHADLSKAKAAVTTRISGIKNLITGSATKIAEIALTAITAGLGPVGKQIMAGLRSAGTSIIKILKDPVAFAKNLINAVKGGFTQFASNAPTNLPKVIGGWLGGNTGITFPIKFDLPGILMTALSVVGLTYQAMRGRLVKALGPGGNEKVSKAETTVQALQTMKGGLQKADEMKAEGGGISSEISAGIKTEVTQSVVLAGIRKLVTMLIPGGGFINAIIGAFQTVQTIVQQAANIGSVIVNGLSSVAAIAAGNISSAVGSIERALVSSLGIALTWLTKVLGLGNLGSKIKGIIAKVKGKLDRVLDKIVAKVKQIIEKITGKSSTGDPKAKPTTDQDKTKDHDEKVKKGLADIPGIEKSFDKNGKLENQEAALNVARAVKGRHTIFKSVTPKFSKEKVTYDWVASRGSQPSSTGLAVLSINVEGIRREFWSKGRPGWSSKTKQTLSKQYPQHHVTLPVVGLTVKLKSGFDRRHIMAFDQTVTSFASQLNNMTYDDAKSMLSAKGFASVSSTESAIKAALKKFLTAEFNKVENLFVDEADENQEKGRQMEAAEQRRNAALSAGDQRTADLEAKRIAQEATDVPKGKISGQTMTPRHRAAISQLQGISVTKFEVLRGKSVSFKTGQADSSSLILWQEAQIVKETLRDNIAILAEFSKSGDTVSNSAAKRSIESATEKIRLLSDILR